MVVLFTDLGEEEVKEEPIDGKMEASENDKDDKGDKSEIDDDEDEDEDEIPPLN